MPPRSPLPQRDGLDAAWLRTPDNDPDAVPRWTTMRDFLLDRGIIERPVDLDEFIEPEPLKTALARRGVLV